MLFHNGSNYDNYFIIKELAKEFEGEFDYLGQNAEKYTTFAFLITKEVERISKNGEEITKTISYKLQLLIAQDLWQDQYQILLIILLKDFIKSNVNMDMIINNVKHVELNTNTAGVVLNAKTLKLF